MTPFEWLEAVLRGLENEGFAVVDDWLSPEACQAIRAETLAARQAGELQEARVGRSGETRRITEIRSDLTRWWDPQNPSLPQAALVARIEELRLALNETFFLGLRDWEGHSAVYEPGAFYGKHLDRFRSDDRRTVSVIVYFNSNWKPGDGGELRVWATPESDSPLTDIEPRSGRAVVFLSDRIPHEVLPAQKPRISFAGWLRRG